VAYDEHLAGRIREVLAGRDGLSERKMFGGIAFMVGGNMAVGVIGSDLMVRVGPAGHDDALAEDHVRPMDFTNRPMRGMVYVDQAGTDSDAELARWVGKGAAFASSLPAK
jgi:TfoX/Sxy family transcriptional regulator of competence genes